MLYELTADNGQRRIVKGWKVRTHGGAPAVPGPIAAWVRDVWLPSMTDATSAEVAEFHPATWGRIAGVVAPYPDSLGWSTVIGTVECRRDDNEGGALVVMAPAVTTLDVLAEARREVRMRDAIARKG